MSEKVLSAGPTVAELEAVLLEAKVSPPRRRPGTVSHAELIGSARGSAARVVGVTAPAGYGKSTLLAEWAEVDDRRVAWVSLDRFDDDPSTLLSLLASAYARISGHQSLVADMSGLGVSALGRAAPRLASAFRTSPVPFIVMLDDLHELRSAGCHDVLGVVISGIPAGSQLVATSRSEQPHVPRMRATGDVVEITASDLALDVAGAEQIFAQAHVEITPEVAALVTEKTEGWPTGLYLAAVTAGDRDGDVSSISGDDRYVADYLYAESLLQLSEPAQRFLRRTAVLDQLCAPLCEAILEEPGAQAQLRAMEATSLFLVPLDRRRGWYRYHALFREFLLGELRRVEPDDIAKLHLRAADWYEQNGSPALAIEHLLNTSERDRCVQLVAEWILPTYQSGQLSTVQRWLATLGAGVAEEYPPLAVLTGWVAVMTGQTADAERWAAFLDQARFAGVPVDGTASFDGARAMFRALICRDGPEQMAADAAFAVAEEARWSPWRAMALILSAESQLLLGNPDQATRLYVETYAVAEARGNINAVVLSKAQLASLAMDGGRWTEAAEQLQHALATIDRYRLHDYPLSVIAFAAAARLAVHRGDRPEADRQLVRAMRARTSCTYVLPFIAVRARTQLAKVYAALGDQAPARHLLREIDELLLHRPALGALVDDVSELRGLVNATRRTAALPGGTPLTPAELRLLPFLQTHLTFREIAERLFVSRNTISSEVGSIYRKLGASSRSDAVDQATRVGLLGG
ncbi:MAG: LuxR C-terminal-related transcriptional regulator [Propionibacteriaceae bacterium]